MRLGLPSTLRCWAFLVKLHQFENALESGSKWKRIRIVFVWTVENALKWKRLRQTNHGNHATRPCEIKYFYKNMLLLFANLIACLEINLALFNLILVSHRRRVTTARALVLPRISTQDQSSNTTSKAKKILRSAWSNKRLVEEFCFTDCCIRMETKLWDVTYTILGFHTIPRDTKDNRHSGHVGVQTRQIIKILFLRVRQHGRHDVRWKHAIQRFSRDSWNWYESGSVDADGSMRFRSHWKPSQIKTH